MARRVQQVVFNDVALCWVGAGLILDAFCQATGWQKSARIYDFCARAETVWRASSLNGFIISARVKTNKQRQHCICVSFRAGSLEPERTPRNEQGGNTSSFSTKRIRLEASFVRWRSKFFLFFIRLNWNWQRFCIFNLFPLLSWSRSSEKYFRWCGHP